MIKRYLKSLDYKLLVAMALLCTIGVLMIYSSSSIYTQIKYEVAPNYFLLGQLKSIFIGLVSFVAFSIFPYRHLKANKMLLLNMGISLTLLIAVLSLGHTSNGAQSWLNIGGFKFQPSELVKLSVIIFLAAAYSNKQGYINNFKTGIFPPLIYIGAILVLVKIQPDLGTSLLIFGVVGCMILASGMKMKKLVTGGLLIGIPLAIFMFFAGNMLISDNQMSRITAFQDPFADAQNSGYQIIHGYIAITNGGFFGAGLGESTQKYGQLPEPHTDFIMAIIAEELGFVGVSVILLGIAFIVFRGLTIARKCPNAFGSLLAIGISSMIALQTFVNIGGLTSIIPLTGVPLPFISYGGTSIMLLLTSMGILTNIHRSTQAKLLKKPSVSPVLKVVK